MRTADRDVAFLQMMLMRVMGEQLADGSHGARLRGSIPGGLMHRTRSGKSRWKRLRRVRG